MLHWSLRPDPWLHFAFSHCGPRTLWVNMGVRCCRPWLFMASAFTGRRWPTPPGISADASSGWTPIGPSPNKAAFVNLHLCVALLETRGVNRCVNVVDNETTTSTFGPLTNWLWMFFPLVQWVTDEWPSNLEPNQTKTSPKNPTLSVLMQTVFLSKLNKLCGLRSCGLGDLVLCLQLSSQLLFHSGIPHNSSSGRSVPAATRTALCVICGCLPMATLLMCAKWCLQCT